MKMLLAIAVAFAVVWLHAAANAQSAPEAMLEEPGAQCWAIASAVITPGNGYVPGVYKDVALSGGSGIEAHADITVDSTGKVVDVTLHRSGRRFVIGDTLTAPIGASGSGFVLTVSSLINVPAAGKEHDRHAPRCRRQTPQNQALSPPPTIPGVPAQGGTR
jgi:hypothetical protein